MMSCCPCRVWIFGMISTDRQKIHTNVIMHICVTFLFVVLPLKLPKVGDLCTLTVAGLSLLRWWYPLCVLRLPSRTGCKTHVWDLKNGYSHSLLTLGPRHGGSWRFSTVSIARYSHLDGSIIWEFPHTEGVHHKMSQICCQLSCFFLVDSWRTHWQNSPRVS